MEIKYMRKIFLMFFLLTIPLNSYSYKDSVDIMKLLNFKPLGVYNSPFPSSIIGTLKYYFYFNVCRYDNIIDEENGEYNFGGIYNFNIKGQHIAIALDFNRFYIGNFYKTEYSIGISKIINKKFDWNTGISFNLYKLKFSSKYYDPILKSLNNYYFNFGISSSASIFERLHVGISLFNLLNSEEMTDEIIDYIQLLLGMGYKFEDYGDIAIGLLRKNGYNRLLLGYGIDYYVFYANLVWDLRNFYGRIIIEAGEIKGYFTQIISRITYLKELGFLYDFGVNFGF